MKLTSFLGVVALATATLLWSQTPPPPGPPRGNDGPWNHRVLLATSADGLKWAIGPEVIAERASVPELFLGPDGRPILLFVDANGETRGALGARVRQDNGAWLRRETNLRGADPNVVRRRDGTYLAYTKEPDGAIIVFDSRDGLHWERRGMAFRSERYRQSTDADVFETRDGWIGLISIGPRLLRCTSADGLTFQTDGEMLELGGSVSDTVAVEGGWRTFFHVNANPRTGGRMLIRSAFTADGKSWKVEDGDRVVAPPHGPAHLGVADPAPLRMPDGSWLMAVKSFIEPMQFAGGPRLPQDGRAPGQGQRPDGARGPRPPGGPWNQDVDVWHVSAAGEVKRGASFERAGVPTIARLADGRLIAAHQYFPANDAAAFDKVAVRFSSDEGANWTDARVIALRGLPEGMRFPFDPTLVSLPDGRVRMYFTSLRGRQFSEDRPAIYSAISGNGVDYEVEPGVRFGVEGRPVIDCAVVLHDGAFHLFAPDNGTQLQPGGEPPEQRPRSGVGYHATSRDGLTFTRQPDVQIEGPRRWLGNAVSDGKEIAFVGTGDGGPPTPGVPRAGIWMAKSSDGATWRLISIPPVPGADPGAVRAKDGGWIIVSTSAPRRNETRPPPERRE